MPFGLDNAIRPEADPSRYKYPTATFPFWVKANFDYGKGEVEKTH